MPHRHSNPCPSNETHRDFIKKTAAATALVAGANFLPAPVYGHIKTTRVALVLDAGDALVGKPPVQWAAEQLREALKARGLIVRDASRLDQAPADSECILIGGRGSAPARELP